MFPEQEMFFSRPMVELPRISAPTAAEVCARSNPSPEGKALLTPKMTPPEYVHALEKNKLPVDSANFMAHGLPEKDGVCWATQSSRMVAPKLSAPEMNALNLTEAWLKNPTPAAKASLEGALQKVDFSGPGSWSAQAALWSAAPPPAVPGAPPVGLVASAVAGAVLLAAGLSVGPAMPAVPKAKPALPLTPLPPEKLLQLQQPKVAAPAKPPLQQPKMMKMMQPFLDLGKGVAGGKVSCC
jgi:hypothetical protein